MKLIGDDSKLKALQIRVYFKEVVVNHSKRLMFCLTQYVNKNDYGISSKIPSNRLSSRKDEGI